MIENITELKTQPIIGQYYMVPCIWITGRMNRRGGGEWIPVVGNKHNDPEIDINREHWHPDPRFMKLTFPGGTIGTKFPNVYVSGEQAELGCVFFDVDDKPKLNDTPTLKRRICRRQMPEFPTSYPSAQFITDRLTKIYVGRKILCGICPHKRMPLESLPRDPDGNVICNGHGLKISMTKGVVIK